MLAVVCERREPAPDHVELILEAPGLGRAEPGQFAHVYTERVLRRPISFSRLMPPDRAGLLFKVVGSGTRWLAARRPGDRLDVLAPLGVGFAEPATDAVVVVGGGVGVPPLYTAAARWASTHAFTAIIGARTASQLLMVDDFAELGVPVETTTEDGSAGQPGRVTGPLARWLAEHPGGTVFACGPTPMLEAVAALTRDRAAAYLAFEQRMGCGVGACLACVVPGQGPVGPTWLRVCHDGPVLRADRVWWGGVGPDERLD